MKMLAVILSILILLSITAIAFYICNCTKGGKDE